MIGQYETHKNTGLTCITDDRAIRNPQKTGVTCIADDRAIRNPQKTGVTCITDDRAIRNPQKYGNYINQLTALLCEINIISTI